MVFAHVLVELKKILLSSLFVCLYNISMIYASDDKNENEDASYSQTTISEQLGLNDNDDDIKKENKVNNNNNNNGYYQQPVYQQYPQQPMPMIFNMSPQPYYQNPNQGQNYNQNEGSRIKKNSNKRLKSKVKKNKDKYLDELKSINDKMIFSNNYDLGDFKNNVKSYRAFTFNWLSIQTLMIISKILKDKSNHKAKFNAANRSTLSNFLIDEFSELKYDSSEGGDYMGGRSIGLIVKICRALTNVKWEWKSIKNRHFAVGFELAHLICPTCLLEFNTGYYRPNVFGGGIKIGLSCGIGGFLTGKLGNFYIKIDLPCLTIPTLIVLLRNSDFKDDETNKRTNQSIFGRSMFDNIYKMIKSHWTFKRINTGWSGSLQNSALVDSLEAISIGLGWIFPEYNLYDY